MGARWIPYNQGEIVGNCMLDGPNMETYGFIYRDGLLEVLPPAPFAGGTFYPVLGSPLAINDAGTLVGGYTDDQDISHGCVYTPETGWAGLPAVFPEGLNPAETASGINGRGDIVGYATPDMSGGAPWQSWILRHGQYTLIELPAAMRAVDTFVNGINDHGDLAGAFVDMDGLWHGFVYQKGRFSRVDVPDSAMPAGLPPGTYVDFTQLGSINNAGQIVGSYGTSDLDIHGVLLSDGVFTTCDLPGTIFNLLTGINEHGVITGTAEGGAVAYYGIPVPPGKAE